MIEHKFFDLKNYKAKELDQAISELDNLSNQEGWLVVCPCGKDNQTLLLRRILQYQQQQVQEEVEEEDDEEEEVEEPPPVKVTKTKKKVKKPTPVFPNAVYP